MQKAISDSSSMPGQLPAFGGLASAVIGGLLVAQAGGSDREFFLSLGFFLGAVGLLGIVIGGVAIGIQLARQSTS